MTPDERIRELRDQIMVTVAMAASEVGGLTHQQADQWWDELSDGILDAFVGIITDEGEEER
jgi:hypothetical protein